MNEVKKVTARNVQYEFIRVVAMIFVIGIHNIGGLPTDSTLRIFNNNVLTLVFFTCNGLFYFLSGKFALQTDCKSHMDYSLYYFKKFQNFIVPIVFYMILRSAYDSNFQVFSKEFWHNSTVNILSNYSSTEYWFLYGLIGHLLLAPFVGKVLIKLDKREMYLFLSLGFIYNIMAVYLPTLGYQIFWGYPFGNWAFYFYLGYCLERIITTKKEQFIVICLGVISFGVSIIQKYHGYTFGIYDLAPTFVLITCAMFFILRNIYVTKSKILNRVICFVGKHSFSVYMLHIVVLNRVKGYIPFTNHYLWYLFATTLLTATISLLLGVVIDNTIVKLIKLLVQKFYDAGHAIIKLIYHNHARAL